jgi:hypothetical protein
MMLSERQQEDSLEFEATVSEDGSLLLPEDAQERLRGKKGKRISLRLTNRTLAQALQDRLVTEEEVGRICDTQFESRENVLRFLMAQGGLAKNRSFRKRAEDVTA